MKRILKWTAIGLAIAAGVALLAAAGMTLATDMRLAKSYTVAVAPLPVANDPAAIETGRHLDYLGQPDENRRLSSLFLSVMNKMGIKADRFGDADQPLARL